MSQLQRRATLAGAVLGALSAFVAISLQAHASDWKDSETEEFHQTYPLSATGSVELENVNGSVQIKAWDRDEVKVDAIKHAGSKQRLQEATIKIDASRDSISIRTEYPHHDHSFSRDGSDPATVEYTLSAQCQAVGDQTGERKSGSRRVNGEVRVSCVNGRLSARKLGGRAELSTVNGNLEASLDRLASPVNVSSVNAAVLLTLPSDAKANPEASTVSGSIRNDFGIPVSKHRFVGNDLNGELGGGGPSVRVSNVNGRIEIRHADDHRPLSPGKNLNHDSDDKDDDMI